MFLLVPIQPAVMPVPALLRACPVQRRFEGLRRVNNASLKVELVTLDTTDKQTLKIYPYQIYPYRVTSKGTPCLRCGQRVQGATAAFARSVRYSWMSWRVLWLSTRYVWSGGSEERQRRYPVLPEEGQDGHDIRACFCTSTTGRLEGFSLN